MTPPLPPRAVAEELARTLGIDLCAHPGSHDHECGEAMERVAAIEAALLAARAAARAEALEEAAKVADDCAEFWRKAAEKEDATPSYTAKRQEAECVAKRIRIARDVAALATKEHA
jgi:hypothetical protein